MGQHRRGQRFERNVPNDTAGRVERVQARVEGGEDVCHERARGPKRRCCEEPVPVWFGFSTKPRSALAAPAITRGYGRLGHLQNLV